MAAVGVLLLAAGLRFYLIDNQSFWNDEGNSARLSERSIRLIIEGTASDIHPPLYYLLLRGWRELVGESELALRLLSAFAGVLTVAATWGLTTAVLRQKTAPIIAALFVAVNPALVYYSQEARMYALLGLWSVLGTLLLLLWWKRPSLPLAIGYVFVGAAGLYTHYFFPVVLLMHGLYVVILILLPEGSTGFPFVKSSFSATKPVGSGFWKSAAKSLAHSWNKLLQFAALGALILLLYAPWLPIFLMQFSGDAIARPAPLPFLTQVVNWLFLGETAVSPYPLVLTTLVVLLCVVGFVFEIRIAIPAGITIFLPILFNYSVGTVSPSFLKFYVVTIPFAGVLLSVLGNIPRVGIWLSWGTVLALIAVMAPSLTNNYFNPEFARADYRSMAARILDEAHPDRGVVLVAPNQWEAFTYYYPDSGDVYPLPKGRTQPTATEIDAVLQPIAAEHDRLYALFWGEAQRDPERLVERWLDENAFKATDEWVGDVRFVTYAVPPEEATQMETAVNVQFGDHITLLGYTLNDTTFRAGDIVQITLFWQTDAPLEQRYKVFLHIFDENNQIIAQRDSEPGGGLALTPTWPVNEVVRDNHGIFLPLGVENGRYQFRLGLYDFADPNNRLQTGEGNDIFLLPEIEMGSR